MKTEELAEKTEKFCRMMAVEMGEDPDAKIVMSEHEVPLWRKYMPMATDFFLTEAYGRVRSKFWDEEKAAEVRLLTEQEQTK